MHVPCDWKLPGFMRRSMVTAGLVHVGADVARPADCLIAVTHWRSRGVSGP